MTHHSCQEITDAMEISIIKIRRVRHRTEIFDKLKLELKIKRCIFCCLLLEYFNH